MPRTFDRSGAWSNLKVSQRTGAGIVDSQELVLVPTPANLQLFSRI